MAWEVICGRVEDVLPTLDAASFDAVLCDPPYGIDWYGAEAWDGDVPGPDVWRLVARALKPGSPVVAAGHPRTYHRLASNLEAAGLEIVDMLPWLHAQGMPKSKALFAPSVEPYCMARVPGPTRPLSARPRNVAIDETCAAVLDEQAGLRVSGTVKPGTVRSAQKGYGGGWAGAEMAPIVSSAGGASRFYFCSKVKGAEREELGHPSPKPVDLCEHYARALMPPGGGRMLVPYAGVGSEMLGALRAGWAEAIGIEMSPEYAEKARERLVAESAQGRLFG